jgi:cytochrome d ubiquinol oxidase subunit I
MAYVAGSVQSLAAADPSQLLPAREQMAFTLGSHIVLVPFGVALTAFILVLNYRGIRHDDEDALRLARRWSKVSAVLFAVGAVSGTVLSFEMGLLWPGLMDRYGAAYGIPFAIEGIFFFLEAIFVSIYIYGWDRLPPWPHFWTGVPVVLSGIGGTAAVVAANSWMNRPAGFDLGPDGTVVDVNPWKVIFNGAFGYEFVHMLLAAYIVAGFLTAAVYAVGMLRGRTDRYHRLGFAVPFVIAAVATPAQLFVGDVAARAVFDHEPAKFAAIEMVPKTASHVPETLGGYYSGGNTHLGIDIPDGASLLSGFTPGTTIKGLSEIPAADRPTDREVSIVHLSFDAMVGIGFALLLLVLWAAWAWWRRRSMPATPWFLRACVAAGPLALVALWAGWIVTEVGRQPFIVVGYLHTADAVTRSGNVWLFFVGTLLIYGVVFTAAGLIVRSMARRWRRDVGADAIAVPYGPDDDSSAQSSSAGASV